MSEDLDRAAIAVTPEEASAPPALRACVFVLGGSLFAVEVTSAREVAVFDSITRVPGAPAFLLGLANLRGAVMPIVDIRALLELPPHRAGTVIKALVLEHGPLRAAIAIEAALGLEPFGEVNAPDGPGLVLGTLRRGDEMVALLDASRILTALALEMRGANQTEEDRA